MKKRKIGLKIYFFAFVFLGIHLKSLAQCSCAGNLLTNPSFEGQNASGWTVNTNNAGAGAGAFSDYLFSTCGSYYIYIDPKGSSSSHYVEMYQEVTASAGEVFSLGVDAGIHDPAATHILALTFYNSSGTSLSGGQSVEVSNVVGTLSRYNLSGTAPAGTTKVRITAHAQGAWTSESLALKLDGFCLTKTTPSPCTTISGFSAIASPNPINQGSSSTLYPSGTGTNSATTYSWSGTGGFSSSNKEPVVSPSGTGTYSYTVTATNSNGTGTCTATASTTLSVTSPCTAISGLSASRVSGTLSTGSSTTLSSSASSGLSGTTTFSWSGTGGFSSTQQNPSTGTLNSAGGYSYTVTATNSNGTGTCTATASTSLTVQAPCTAISGLSASPSSSSFATGNSTTLNASASSGLSGSTSFSWSGGSTGSPGGFSSTQQNPSTGTLNTAGGYYYTVTATNANGTGTCTATATTSLTVSTTPNPCSPFSIISASVSPTAFATGNSANLSVSGGGITAGVTTFSWSGGSTGSPGGFSSTQQNPSTGTLNTAGGYSYTVTATNANGTGTCTATASTSLTVNPAPVFDLALRKTLASGQNSTLIVGSTVTFTISIINQGNVDATNIQVTDYIPAGLTLNDATWTSVLGGKTTLVVPIANLLAGATITRNISFTVTATGVITNYAEISESTGGIDVDSTPDNDGTNDGIPQNDVITGQRKTNPTDDEDDHDLETISTNCGTPNCVQIRVNVIR